MRKDQLNQILNDIVELINAERDIKSKKTIEHYSNRVKEQYLKVINDNALDEFYATLRLEFNNDPELYLLLLSVLYFVLNDEMSLKEVCRILCEEDVEFFAALNVRAQVENAVFLNPKLKHTYSMRREVHQHLLHRIENLSQLNLTPVAWQERSNTVIIVTNQLLSQLHAPTKIVLEMCRCLQKDFGYQVLLIVAPEEMNPTRMFQFWYNPIAVNYEKKYNEKFLLEYNGEIIQGYQILINKANLGLMKELLNEMAAQKPVFAWYIGNMTFFADLMRQFTSVVAMPCTDGYAISEAQIMLSYMNSGSEDVEASKLYNQEKGQTMAHFGLDFYTYQKADKIYTREQFAIPKDNFAITIVGNRLDSEISDEFIDLLNYILKISERITFVFIGIFNGFQSRMENAIKLGRAIHIGYQKDLVEVISLMDLFLNPERKGAGGGAARALSVGVPVVTLNHCDVANVSGKEFICSSKDEIIPLIEKYYNDSAFYQQQRQIALDRASAPYDFKAQIQSVISEVQKLNYK